MTRRKREGTEAHEEDPLAGPEVTEEGRDPMSEAAQLHPDEGQEASAHRTIRWGGPLLYILSCREDGLSRSLFLFINVWKNSACRSRRPITVRMPDGVGGVRGDT